MDALNALGLAYGSDDDEEDEEEIAAHEPPRQQQQQQQQQQHVLATLPAVSLPPLAAKAGLPDAAALGLPDKDDWEAHSEEEEEAPAHDRVGTTYNAVAVPKSIASATEEHNYKATKAPHSRNAGAAVKEALASVATVAAGSSSGSKGESGSAPTAAGSGASASKPKARTSGGMLLPPQLSGRRNVTTEELSSMRTAKRHKH